MNNLIHSAHPQIRLLITINLTHIVRQKSNESQQIKNGMGLAEKIIDMSYKIFIFFTSVLPVSENEGQRAALSLNFTIIGNFAFLLTRHCGQGIFLWGPALAYKSYHSCKNENNKYSIIYYNTNKTCVSSIIHSARPTVPPLAFTILT